VSPTVVELVYCRTAVALVRISEAFNGSIGFVHTRTCELGVGCGMCWRIVSCILGA
jgi:hypothetical protein